MKQLASSAINKNNKLTHSGQQTRRSMISRQQNPTTIYQPNIEDILALQLSDTLINAAYNLAVTRITVGIQKICDPSQTLFYRLKFYAFENIRIYSNRKSIVKNDSQTKYLNKQLQKLKSSSYTQINLLQQSRIHHSSKNDLIVLTKQQQKEKVHNTVVKKLERMSKIISLKINKIKFQALARLQIYDPSVHQKKQTSNNSIQQIFQKYQQSRMKSRHFHRRSIDKQPHKKSFNQLTYSLNKNPQLSNRLKSPQHKQKSKNLIYTYSNQVNHGQKNDKKASTCSQTQSNNSQKQSQSLSRQYYTQTGKQTGKSSQQNSILNRLKVTSPTKMLIRPNKQMDDSKVSSILLNGSYFAQGTKQRELQILRKKYYRLVQEFKDFSQRFLQVIKEE